MKTEPNIVSDTVAFLTKPDLPTAVYWIALLAGIVVAVRAWRADPDQRCGHGLVVDHAAIPLQAGLYANLVIPNIKLFGPLVYLTEASIALSLMLGLFTRWFALLGLLMAANLWLGLYSAQGEWPWTYPFLMVIQMLFVIDPPGRWQGLDGERSGQV